MNSDIADKNLINEIKEALKSVSYGSIEIFIQNKTITQITVRNIKKTSVEIETNSQKSKVVVQNSRISS